jgi:hypothetical protein
MIPVADIFNLVRSITEWPRFPSACKHPVLSFRFGAKPWVLHQDTLIERSVLNTHGHQLTTLGDAQETPLSWNACKLIHSTGLKIRFKHLDASIVL